MANLLLRNINKIYSNNVQAVFDFNLEVKDKEFIVFVGPSGCGKSTTLRMIAGLEEITSGELFLDGELINDVQPKFRNMAMVFQSYALYPQYTVYENMAFSLKLRKAYMPIYKKNEEIDKIEEENRELRKQAHQIEKLFIRKQNSLDLLEKRNALYDVIFINNDKIEKLQEPIVGIDEKMIKSHIKDIKKLEKQIKTIEKDIEKYYFEDSPIKDTLLKTIEDKKTKIKVFNERIDYLSSHEVPLTVYRKLTRNEIDNEVNKTARSIDLTRYLFRKPAALSGGQRQRVALGRAIVRKPKVFLMDEPLSNLDAKLRVQTRAEIIRIHESVGATTIYVTHDQTEAMTMATRIVVMKDGYIQQIGTPSEIYNDPNNKFVGGFIGSPSMNFIDGEFDGNNKIVVKDNDRYISISLNEKDSNLLKNSNINGVTLGVRPEDIGIADKDTSGHYCDVFVEFSELLGDQILTHFKVNDKKLVMKNDASVGLRNHEMLPLKFNTDKLYFFDADDGKRIR